MDAIAPNRDVDATVHNEEERVGGLSLLLEHRALPERRPRAQLEQPRKLNLGKSMWCECGLPQLERLAWQALRALALREDAVDVDRIDQHEDNIPSKWEPERVAAPAKTESTRSWRISGSRKAVPERKKAAWPHASDGERRPRSGICRRRRIHSPSDEEEREGSTRVLSARRPALKYEARGK
eukprot:scaffold112076_cov30-Tisochrysis_lutea.AAC.5